MSARSWVRTRSARSAVRSEASRKTQGPTTMARPTIGQQGGDRDVAGHADRPAAEREQHQRGDDQPDAGGEPGVRRPAAAAEHGPERVDPAGGVEPALALGLVGLAPEQGDADQADEHRPEHRALPEHRLEQQDRAEAERGQRDRRADVGQPADPAGSAAAAAGAREAGGLVLEVGVGRQHQPEAGVHRHAQAAEDGREHEARAHPDHGDGEVPGQTRGDAHR